MLYEQNKENIFRIIEGKYLCSLLEKRVNKVGYQIRRDVFTASICLTLVLGQGQVSGVLHLGN